ncbi:MAG: DUF4443 domain-containing protein [Candidatus Hermodarchaeota archaeon]
MFDELDPLWRSPTIKPSFELVHVILALFLFEENKEGIGRYRLQKELSIGSGTAKSLIKKLNEDLNFIKVLTEDNVIKGHILTNIGLEFVEKIKQKFPLISEGDTSEMRDILIKSEGKTSYVCFVRNSIDKITYGIEQRDAAIKIGGDGATCLLYNGEYLIFPSYTLNKTETEEVVVDNRVFKYICSVIQDKGFQLQKNDVIIIGLGDTLEFARLAALNAALTLL